MGARLYGSGMRRPRGTEQHKAAEGERFYVSGAASDQLQAARWARGSTRAACGVQGAPRSWRFAEGARLYASGARCPRGVEQLQVARRARAPT